MRKLIHISAIAMLGVSTLIACLYLAMVGFGDDHPFVMENAAWEENF